MINESRRYFSLPTRFCHLRLNDSSCRSKQIKSSWTFSSFREQLTESAVKPRFRFSDQIGQIRFWWWSRRMNFSSGSTTYQLESNKFEWWATRIDLHIQRFNSICWRANREIWTWKCHFFFSLARLFRLRAEPPFKRFVIDSVNHLATDDFGQSRRNDLLCSARIRWLAAKNSSLLSRSLVEKHLSRPFLFASPRWTIKVISLPSEGEDLLANVSLKRISLHDWSLTQAKDPNRVEF